MFVCHMCDMPSCVNPDHLFLGTQDENMRDKVQKHRQARGELHGSARLTEEIVREIRASTRSQEALGREYGVSQVAISRIKLGKNWKHVPEELPPLLRQRF